jgi:phage shock protein A
MAPTTQLLRISELEAQSQAHEVKLAVLTESHERLERDVAMLKSDMKDTNDAVAGIKLTLAQWSVGVALIIAAGTAIGGWFVKSSLDALKSSLVTSNSK